MFLSLMSEGVWPMFSSKGFIVSGLMCRSLIHFEFIFVYGVRECSNFILLQHEASFSLLIWMRQKGQKQFMVPGRMGGQTDGSK